ncbi:MAG: hypothetical protein Kapaf2KO_10830 [Candidatus Kapaibacteriales bacterium]
MKIISIIIAMSLFSLTVLAQKPIVFPIEVFKVLNDEGNQWESLSDIIEVTTKDFNNDILYLYLKVNNLNKESAMYYRVNNGIGWTEWQKCIPDFTLFQKDSAYGGIGGGFGTVQFTTPISYLKPNFDNKIEFIFFQENGDKESGYRIIDMEIWEENSNNSINLISNDKNYDDPSTWVGPYGKDNIEKANYGADLWFGRNGSPNLINENGEVIKASCSSCHAQSGYDLKYFNYSNKSIEARSTFHGLTREQGRLIAQYIRDLPTEASQNGRPWQPPYQPGPNIDKIPFEWSAGAGLENVLENEDSLLLDLFGSTYPSETEIRMAINNYKGNTNIRQQRISTQFPDWNQWLPEVHPIDILNEKEYQSIEKAFGDLRKSLDSEQKRVDLNNKPNVLGIYANNGLFEVFGKFANAIHKIVDDPTSGLTVGNFPISPIWADNSTSLEREEMKKSLAAWYSVKLFEVIQEYELYKVSSLGNIPEEDQEALQWPTREWAVFQNAAHIISGNRVTSFLLSDVGDETKEKRSIYLSSLWYQLQLTLTPGHRKGGLVNPNDFAYNLQHIHKLEQVSGIAEPIRFFQNYLKNAEQRNNGLKPEVKSGVCGWNMRELSPWRIWSDGRGSTSIFDPLEGNLRKNLRNIFMDETADILLSFNENDWPRTSVDECNRTDFALEFRNTVPINGFDYEKGHSNCVFYDRRCGGGCEDANDAVEIDAFFTLLNILDDNNEIKESTFNKLRDFAIARWDFSDWPTYKTEIGSFDNNKSSQLSPDFLYPNPANDIIVFNGLSPYIDNLEICDLYGSVYSFPIRDEQIDVSMLTKGVYFIIIDNKSFKFTKI